MSADAPVVRRCAVLGSPVGHSLSPVLHRAAYEALGLSWTYDAREVTESGLAAFLGGLDASWRGLSLTMPLKRAVIGLCDLVEPLGRELGSINTVLIDDGGRREGRNTDVPGFAAAFGEAGVDRLDRVVVLGAGATAASALASAARLGTTSAVVLARSTERAARLTSLRPLLGLEISVRPLADVGSVGRVDAVISTIPAAAQAPFAETLAERSSVMFEVVYQPQQTPLLRAARRRGRIAIPGFALLLHQAALQVELMTGRRPPPLEEMRAAGLAALGNL